MRNLSPFAKRIILWAIAFVLAAGVFCLVFFLRQQFTVDGVSDACFLASTAMLAGLGYLLLRRMGTFDIVEYSFFRLGESFARGNKRRYETAYDFAKARKDKRETKKPYFWPFLIIGGAFLLAALICLIIFETTAPR